MKAEVIIQLADFALLTGQGLTEQLEKSDVACQRALWPPQSPVLRFRSPCQSPETQLLFSHLSPPKPSLSLSSAFIGLELTLFEK